MLDGRTIHFYFQYIEESLVRKLPSFSRDGKFDFAACVIAAIGSSTISIHLTAPAYVASRDRDSKTGSAGFVKIFEEALSLIEQAELSWLVHLGLVAVIETKKVGGPEELPGVLRISAEIKSDPEALAREMIRVAGAGLACLCWYAEEKTRSDFLKILKRVEVEAAAKALGSTMLNQFVHRLFERDGRIQMLEGSNQTIVDAPPLLKHIQEFWGPSGKQVLEDVSPFDFGGNLAELGFHERNGQ
jgi:hypothetical protein